MVISMVSLKLSKKTTHHTTIIPRFSASAPSNVCRLRMRIIKTRTEQLIDRAGQRSYVKLLRGRREEPGNEASLASQPYFSAYAHARAKCCCFVFFGRGKGKYIWSAG